MPMACAGTSDNSTTGDGDYGKKPETSAPGTGWGTPVPFETVSTEPENRTWLFRLVPKTGYVPQPIEVEIAKLINDKMGNFKGELLKNTPHGYEIGLEMKSCCEDLLESARDFCKGGRAETILAVVQKRIVLYDGAIGYIKSLPGLVQIIRSAPDRAKKLQFNIGGATLSLDQEQLIGGLSRAQTVVDVVLAGKAKKGNKDTIENQRSGYIFELADIAQKGLEQSDRVRLATLMLENFKSDFVTR